MQTDNKLPDFPRKFVYFEKQANDKLCGVHCLNSLVQGPLFDPFSLAEIAHKLDDEEKKLYEEDINSNMSNNQGDNVDDDGNYNVQVLSEALKIYGIEIEPVKKSEVEKILVSNSETVEAFIFNSSTHWFSLRRINNIWFNLNSTNPGPGPQIISEFYLSAFVKGTEELGYTNFLVKNINNLPDLDSDTYKNLAKYQKLVPIEDIIKYKPKKINIGDTDDDALERAMELSKKEFEKGGGIVPKENEIWSAPSSGFPNYNINDFGGMAANMIEENELKAVMEMSLNEYIDDLNAILPKEPSLDEVFIDINIKPCDKDILYSRRFSPQDKISSIKTFARIKLRTYSDVKLFGQYNNKIYVNDDDTIEQSNIKDKDTLLIQEKL